MGMWVTTKLAFGIDLGNGIPAHFFLSADPDEEYQEHDYDIHNFFTAWLEAQGKDFDFPFDILTYSSYDPSRARYFLAYTPSVISGGSSEPLYIKTPEFDVAAIKKMIEDNGFGQNITPVWAVVSLYG